MARVAAVAVLGLVAAPAGAIPPAQASTGGTAGSTPGFPSVLPAGAPEPGALVRPAVLDRPPAGRRLTGRRVLAIADAVGKVRAARRSHPGSTHEVYVKSGDRWQVSYYATTKPGRPRKEIAQVVVDDASGGVLEAWTGYQVAWTMARGYPGAFGRRINSPWVWIPLSVLFVAPFVQLRRPWRLLHLDLLALSAFSLSLAFFNAADIGTSVPLVYPPLVYLAARMLWVGLRRRVAEEQARVALPLAVPVTWLAVAVVFLAGFRVALNVTSSNVIDVGYAGVIGADRMAHGQPLYGHFPEDNQHGDTYGPVAYAAYVPFELALPWTGTWDDLPAAHAAAVVFDLLACLLCFLIGRRARGPNLGVVLAYAWATFPFTLYASMSNANDGLVAVLVLAALWAAVGPRARPAASAVGRGVFVALAGLTKFAPLGLAPLLMPRGSRGRAAAVFALAMLATGALAFAPVIAHLSVHRFWDATIAFQADRASPFSVWGLYHGAAIDAAQHVVQGAAVLLALALAVLPRRDDAAGLAALSAAILIALQLGVSHWFYLYIPWFFPLVMLALLGRWGEPAPAPARWRRPASALRSAPAPP